MGEAEREPCPFRIFEDMGSAFCLGERLSIARWCVRLHVVVLQAHHLPLHCLCLSILCAGAVGGAMWHFVKGYRNAPKHTRLAGAFTAARMRAPILGGNFGVWGGLFAVFDCSLAYSRGVEDPWNAIAAGGLTGATLAARAGPKAMARNGVVGMVLIAIIEGVGIAFSKFIMQRQMEAMAGGRGGLKDTLEPPIPPGFGSGSLLSRASRDQFALR